MARILWPGEREHECGKCGSKSGRACVTVSGKVAKEPHTDRIDKWYRAGLEDGSIRVMGLS